MQIDNLNRVNITLVILPYKVKIREIVVIDIPVNDIGPGFSILDKTAVTQY